MDLKTLILKDYFEVLKNQGINLEEAKNNLFKMIEEIIKILEED